METDSKLYAELDKAWKSTCRIVLGGEVGELRDFEPWLAEYMSKVGRRKSYVSGKEVSLAMDDYCDRARFVSMDEAKERSVDPLTINQVKDLDSIVDVVSNQWEYIGNRSIGSSSSVGSSDLIIDSHYVLNSSNIQQCARSFACSNLRMNCKQTFGSMGSAGMEFTIRTIGSLKCVRAFECLFIFDCSDIYLSNFCNGCHDMLFCFSQRNRNNCIGNLQLPKEKYQSLKTKLLGELREELKRSKKFPSILQLIPNESQPMKKSKATKQKEKGNLSVIDRATASVFKITLKREITGIDDYGQWLTKYGYKMKSMKTPFGSEAYLPKDNRLSGALLLTPEKRVASYADAEELSGLHLKEEDVTSLRRIIERLPDIEYVVVSYSEGRNHNAIECASVTDSSNVYRSPYATFSEYCAFSSSPLRSKYVLGGVRTIESEFSINCYNSLHLSRCFEMDACNNCSDSYFCHNSDSLAESMFCWNVKSKRYAIGNAQLPQERYKRIKGMLLEQMADEIEKDKGLRYSILDIGCGKR